MDVVGLGRLGLMSVDRLDRVNRVIGLFGVVVVAVLNLGLKTWIPVIGFGRVGGG